jgi:hypothetical protein
MDWVPVQQIEVKKTVRLICPGPVDMKHHKFMWFMVLRKFEESHGHEPTFDDDVWIEPYNEGIAYCYLVTRTEEGAT